ncbi:MAG: prohibitin family protein, partial [Myxococcota bacterium]
PWNTMYVYDIRIQDGPERLSILASNGLSVGLDVSIRFRPTAAALPDLHQQIGPNYYGKIIKPTIRSEVRKVVGQYTPEEIYSTKRQEVETSIVNVIEAALVDKFISVEAMLIRSVELPEKLRIAISDKLEEEQRSEKMAFTLARERQEAERKAIEAKGIADFQRIVSQGLTQDLLRWKGIEATESIARSENAKVVVIGSGPDGLPLILGGN